MITIGLTGGIASGKSTVSKLLDQCGARVIDVDKVAHETYARGTPGADAIREAFGDGVIGSDGEIDRRALGGIVFGSPAQLKKLTDIVWPLTRQRLEAIKSEEAAAKTSVLVLEAAVLNEAGWQDLMDEIWVVSVPIEVARQRLMERNGITREQADARIASQMSNEERERGATVVIDNSGDLAALERNLKAAWNRRIGRAA